MLLDVSDAGSERGTDQLPNELTTVPELLVEAVDNERYLTLTSAQTDDYGRKLHLLGTAQEQSGLTLDDAVTEDPTLGDTEIWSFANLTAMSHPIHLHLVHFQMLGRQPLGDYDPAEDDIEPGALEAPEPYERGWNDVVTVDPAEVVHVIVHFGEYEGIFNDQTGEYMWHCHMIEHEDHDMMRPFRVLPNADEDLDTESDNGDE